MSNNDLSRRKLLFLGGAAMLLPTAAKVDAAQQNPPDPLANKKTHNISVITSDNPDFVNEVETRFPGLTGDTRFQMMAPLSALVIHESGPAVRAYSTRWVIVSPLGTYDTALFHCAPPYAHRKARKGRTIASGQKNLLRKGEAKLVTPFFTLSPKAYRKSPTGWHSHLQQTEPGAFMISQLPTATKIQVSLDAAVFSDRGVIGQDKHRLADRLASRRHAERDQAHSVLKLLKAGKSNEEIAQALLERGTTARSNAPDIRGWYDRARRHHAQVLLKKLGSLNRSTFERHIVRLARLRKTKLHRVKV